MLRRVDFPVFFHGRQFVLTHPTVRASIQIPGFDYGLQIIARKLSISSFLELLTLSQSGEEIAGTRYAEAELALFVA